MKKRKGVVMVVTLFILVLIMIAASTALFLSSRSIFVTGGQERAFSAFESAEGGIERAMQIVHEAFSEGIRNIQAENIKIRNYDVQIEPQFIATAVQAGGAMEFAVGYLGIGVAASRGGATNIYLIASTAQRAFGESAGIEVVQRKVIGLYGGD